MFQSVFTKNLSERLRSLRMKNLVVETLETRQGICPELKKLFNKRPTRDDGEIEDEDDDEGAQAVEEIRSLIGKPTKSAVRMNSLIRKSYNTRTMQMKAGCKISEIIENCPVLLKAPHVRRIWEYSFC